MIRLVLAAIIGAGIAGGVAWIISANEAWAGLVIPCFIVGTVLIPVIIVARTFLSTVKGTVAVDVEAAERDGRIALARILTISRTGTLINDQPVCDIDLLVAPRYAQAFQVRARRIVDLLEIPRFQPGAVVVVATDRREPSPVAFVPTPSPEWQRLAETDEQIRTMTHAPQFEPTPEDQKQSRLRRIHPAFYVVAIIAGAALALIPAYSTIAAIAAGETTIDEVRYAASWEGQREAEERAAAEAEAEASMFVGDNAEQARDALVEVAGGTQAVSLTFSGSYASLVAPSEPGAQTLDNFSYNDGEASRTGAHGSQPEPGELEAQLFDVSTIDLSLMPGLIEEAMRLSGIDEFTDDQRDTWVYIDTSTVVVDGVAQEILAFDVPISGEYYDAWITFDMAGDVIDMRGGAPGSESFIAEQNG